MTDPNLPVCRHCGAALTLTLVDLGLSPLANSYVPPERAGTTGPRYPLHARVCESCWLVQVDDAVPADEIFSADYAYFSSFSDSWLAHCRAYTELMTERLGLGPDSLVVEIASNDGYLLQYFVQKGIPVLGIEPSGSVAKVAQEKGVPASLIVGDDEESMSKWADDMLAAFKKPPAPKVEKPGSVPKPGDGDKSELRDFTRQLLGNN